MKRLLHLAALMFITLLIAPAGSWADDFTDLLGRLNARATVDLGVFKADASVEFNLPLPRIEAVIRATGTPGDAYICLETARVLKTPPEEVAKVFVKNKDKGWGAIAKEMGIKPGSPEFMALKKGSILKKSHAKNDSKGEDMGQRDKGGKNSKSKESKGKK